MRAQGGRATRAKRLSVEAVLAAAAVLGPLAQGVVLGIRAETGELAGLLVMADDRVRDAYSPEEVALLEGLAAQIGVVIENSLVYQRMQERDRLAAIGQMAARLAHEVKNPLGAIKGAAQLLAEPAPGASELDAVVARILGIILEEVDRLDRVVGSVLDYARPSKGHPAPDRPQRHRPAHGADPLVQRDDELSIEFELADDLPRVRVDAEQLRQVLMNLVRNAMQAMNGPREGRRGNARSARAPVPRVRARGARLRRAAWVELRVTDSGPGISQKVLKNLFVAFLHHEEPGHRASASPSASASSRRGRRHRGEHARRGGTTFTVVLARFGRSARPTDPGGSRRSRPADDRVVLATPRANRDRSRQARLTRSGGGRAHQLERVLGVPFGVTVTDVHIDVLDRSLGAERRGGEARAHREEIDLPARAREERRATSRAGTLTHETTTSASRPPVAARTAAHGERVARVGADHVGRRSRALADRRRNGAWDSTPITAPSAPAHAALRAQHEKARLPPAPRTTTVCPGCTRRATCGAAPATS